MIRRLLGVACVLAGGCGTAPTILLTPERITVTVTRTDPSGQDFYRVRIRLEARGRILADPLLHLRADQWATYQSAILQDGIVWKGGNNAPQRPRELRTWRSGLFLAVRCAPTPDGRIATNLVAYSVRDGRIAWSRKWDWTTASGETRMF